MPFHTVGLCSHPKMKKVNGKFCTFYHTHAQPRGADTGFLPTKLFSLDWLIHELGFQNGRKTTTVKQHLLNPAIYPLIRLHVCELFFFFCSPLPFPIFRETAGTGEVSADTYPVSGGLSAFPRTFWLERTTTGRNSHALGCRSA